MCSITQLRRLMQTNKIMIFQPIYSSIGWWLARAQPDSSGCKRGLILDRTPFHCKAHSHPHSHCRLTSSSNCITETWWGAGRGNMRIPHKQWPQPGISFFFFLISITMKKCWPEQCHLRTCSIGYMHYAVATEASSPQVAVNHWRGQAETQACRCADHQEGLGEGPKFLLLAD